jgi:PTS system mannose-specific IIA component
MIGLVLVTHGRLADEFRAALEHVVGQQERIEAVSIGADDDMEQRRQDSGPVELIAGLNLPMLIKLAQARNDSDLPTLVEAARDAGRKYIGVASALLSTKPA